ncbi:ribosome biogenesis GTPase YlqF [Ruminococcus flavefaciens]|uniref:ribosome biogenesis GTPase YlqF n=1 Tax=Ruminococcus flavefaciens TaxID=1265 RepID=UPI0026EBA9F0|nr:ribosome biogenesis GTPase YlqF [Ruminococcus flavefaciens]MDD7516745.1 ribosome biogenesis GTPase YlqF [Ruminococcus flavefaciens]MDY5692570.1 ribosome biogenesis GTPase YlqF [Ruminococcus flavefaciens]
MDNIDMKQIQWFPGHMAKTRRLIASNLSLVDAVVEIVDARSPLSSRNPEMDHMTKNKPRLVLLNKSDLADERTTQQWINYFRKNGSEALAVDCKSGKGLKAILPAIKNTVLRELMEKRAKNGMTGAAIRLMIVGIPNVGKSSLINKLAGSKRAKVEDRPGVTRTKQWVKLDNNTELLDMPGVLWPKFEDQDIAVRLAFTGAISDDILDIETLAMKLLSYLAVNYPESLKERYKIDLSDDDTGLELLEKVGKKRGMMISGGEINTERAAITVLDEFRSGKLGRITLEVPKKEEQ